MISLSDLATERNSEIPPTSTTPRHEKEKKHAPPNAAIAPGLGESDRDIGPSAPMTNGDYRVDEVCDILVHYSDHGCF